jgi:hypothetical protein
MKVVRRTGAMESVNQSQLGGAPVVAALMQELEQSPTSKRRTG